MFGITCIFRKGGDDMDIDLQHFRKFKVKSNFVVGEDGKLEKEKKYLARHPERPLRYAVVARRVWEEKGVKVLKFSVEVVRY